MTDSLYVMLHHVVMKGIRVCSDNSDLSVLSKRQSHIKLNPIQVVSIIAIIILGGIAGLTKYNAAKSKPNSTETEILVDTPQIAPHYFDYSRVSLAKAKQNGRTVLFFAATTWCSNCAEIDKEIKERNSELPKDLTILKVDYDKDTAMKTKYGVTMQTTLILFDKNGTEIKRWIGTDFDNLLTNSN